VHAGGSLAGKDSTEASSTSSSSGAGSGSRRGRSFSTMDPDQALSAVDPHLGPGDVVRGVGCEEVNHPGDLHGGAGLAAQRMPSARELHRDAEVLDAPVVCVVVDFGLDRAGTDGVDADPVRSEL